MAEVKYTVIHTRYRCGCGMAFDGKLCRGDDKPIGETYGVHCPRQGALLIETTENTDPSWEDVVRAYDL